MLFRSISLYQHPMMAEYIKGQEKRLMSSINTIIKKSCFKEYGVIAEKISSTSKNIPNTYRIYCKTQQLDSVESLIKILVKLNSLDSETIFSGNLAQLNMRLVSQKLTAAPIKNLAELLEEISTNSVGEVQVESLPNHLYKIKYGNVPIRHTEVSTEEITLETKDESVPLKFSEEEEKIIQAVMEGNYATH